MLEMLIYGKDSSFKIRSIPVLAAKENLVKSRFFVLFRGI